MQVFALVALGAEALGEEEAEVGAGDFVGAGVAGVGGDVAAGGGGGLGQVFVFAVAAGPFVVPDVEDGAGLGGGLGFDGGGVDLGAGGSSFAADDLFGLFDVGGVRRVCSGEGGCGAVGDGEIGGGGVGCWRIGGLWGF